MVLDLQGPLMMESPLLNPKTLIMVHGARWRTLGWRAWCWTCRAR